MPHGDFGSSGWLFLGRIKATRGPSPRTYVSKTAPAGDIWPAKSPANRAGLCVLRTTLLYMQTLLRRRGLHRESLERLVGLLGEIGIELAHLGRLGDEALIGRLRVVGLDLDCLVERFGAQQLFHNLGAVLERLLGIVHHLSGDRLAGFGEHA